MNIFITKIDQMDEASWNFAESVYGEDRIFFIPDANGNIPYYTVNKINSLSIEPEFLPINTIGGLGQIIFSLALACSDVDNATIYICSTDPSFEQLNEAVFDTKDGGKINIIVCDGMDCITYNDGDSEIMMDTSDENSSASETNMQNMYTVPDITIPDIDEPNLTEQVKEKNEEVEKTVSSIVDEKEEKNAGSGQKTSTLSIKLLNTMQKIDKTGVLTKNANAIIDAIKENDDGSIMTLNFIIHDKIEDETVADAVMSILGEETVLEQLIVAI